MIKILIISPAWIGDTILSHSMLQLLTIQYKSKVMIDVITSSWCKAVVYRMPEVNQVFSIPYSHGNLALKKCYHFSKFLKTKKYQQAIILPNSFKSALIPFFAGITIRTGWRGEIRYGLLNDLRIFNKKHFPLMIHRYAALAYQSNTVKNFSEFPQTIPWPYLQITSNEIKSVLNKFYLNDYNQKKQPLIGLCPGTEFGPAKNWPHYHYIELTIKLILCGYHVIILGSHKDQAISTFMQQKIPSKFKNHYHNLIGFTSLDEAIAIIASCQGIVSNDSGLMHIACALQRPTVALYGLSSPAYTPPLFNQSIAIRRIRGYYKIKKGKEKFGYHNSLINISPNEVLKELKKLLN